MRIAVRVRCLSLLLLLLLLFGRREASEERLKRRVCWWRCGVGVEVLDDSGGDGRWREMKGV